MAERIFTMLQVNDVHLTVGEDPRNTRGKLRALVGMLGRGAMAARPDVVVLAGDLVDHADSEEIACFAGLIRPLLEAQTLAVPGNHDAVPPEAPPRNAPFFQTFQSDAMGKAVFFRGVLFLLVNDANGDRDDAPWIGARNRWLAAQLEEHRDRPKIIVAHVPLVAMRDVEPLAASFDFPTWKSQDPEGRLLGLIEAHADTVIAVVGGHLHLTGKVEKAGIHHIVPCGLMSWPYDAAWYEFYEHDVVVRMVSLPEDVDPGVLGALSLRNGVHDRHGREFSDGRHATMREYIAGLPEEREFVISLRGKKVIRQEIG